MGPTPGSMLPTDASLPGTNYTALPFAARDPPCLRFWLSEGLRGRRADRSGRSVRRGMSAEVNGRSAWRARDLAPGNFVRCAVAGNASLVFVTELLARRFSRFPARGGPPGGASPR